MNAGRSYPWILVFLATAFGACAHDERPRHGAPVQSDSSYFDTSQGGPITVVIDGRTYTGLAQQVVVLRFDHPNSNAVETSWGARAWRSMASR